MQLDTIKSSIVQANENIIVQLVNCVGYPIGFVNNELAIAHPEMQVMYANRCKAYPYDKDSLLGGVQFYVMPGNKSIANVFAQIRYGEDARHVDYQSLGKGLDTIADIAKRMRRTVALPLGIGCTKMSGGSWSEVEPMIQRCFKYVKWRFYDGSEQYNE